MDKIERDAAKQKSKGHGFEPNMSQSRTNIEGTISAIVRTQFRAFSM